VYCINIFTDRFCQTFSFSISDLNHFVVNEKSVSRWYTFYSRTTSNQGCTIGFFFKNQY